MRIDFNTSKMKITKEKRFIYEISKKLYVQVLISLSNVFAIHSGSAAAIFSMTALT